MPVAAEDLSRCPEGNVGLLMERVTIFGAKTLSGGAFGMLRKCGMLNTGMDG